MHMQLTRTLAGLLFVFALLAAAGIDFNQPLVGLDGKPILTGDAKAPIVLTLGEASVTALENTLEEDKTATGAEKFKRDELARKVYKKSDVVLTAEEIALIKDRIGKSYGALVVGAAWRILDPAMQAKDAPAK